MIRETERQQAEAVSLCSYIIIDVACCGRQNFTGVDRTHPGHPNKAISSVVALRRGTGLQKRDGRGILNPAKQLFKEKTSFDVMIVERRKPRISFPM